MKGMMLSQNPERIVGRIRCDNLTWIESFLEDPPSRDFESLVEFLKKEKPDLIVGGGSEAEKLLLSRLCARLSIPIFTNCQKMNVAEEIRLFRADSSGENLEAFTCGFPCIVSFADVFPDRETQEDHQGTSDGTQPPSLSQVSMERLLEDPRIQVVSREPLPGKNREDILVCVGRGAGARGVTLAKTLAGQIGAQLGCTRAIVEDGLMDRSFQIGQSGKSVSPELYLGFGVSGAFQHQVGMRQSRRIVGVNVSPNAPLFSLCETGLIGDAREVLRILVDKTNPFV